MTEEVRGRVTDRPWGMTLGAIALRRHTGQLAIESDGKRYVIAFDDGAIVNASSPLAADAIARIAVTSQFITSTQVADITRRIAMAPERDEVDVLAEAIGCSPEQVGKLRNRLVAQRAARTFQLERGEFVLDGQRTLPVFEGVAIDHRQAIFLGARSHLSDQRLGDDLRQFGSFFVLKPEAIDELPRFGFEPSAQAVIDALRLGTSLPELEASHRELEPRLAQAVIYALMSCNACTILPRTMTQQPRATRTTTGSTQQPRTTTGAANERASRTSTTTRPEGLAVGDGAAPPSSQPRLTPVKEAFAAVGAAPPRTLTSPRTATSPRTVTPPLAGRASTGSSTTYTAPPGQDDGSNTPAATRARTTSDPLTRTPSSTNTPPHGTPQTQPRAASAPTTPPGAVRPPTRATYSAAPPPPPGAAAPPRAAGAAARGTGAPPSPPGDDPPTTARTETEDGMSFSETPTPLPTSAKQSVVTFGVPQPARSAAPTTPGTAPAPSPPATRPSVPRVPTSEAEVVRTFAEQRTPTFGDQRTPTFGEQRTPADQRTPTDPSMPRAPTGPATSRVSTDNAAAAEAAFKRGELAMKRDQPGEAVVEFKAACELNPAEVDYAAMLAWAKFCAAGDKPAIAADTRKLLERAVAKSLRPERARFYLGRVERMLGRDKEALRHFQEVIDLKANHAEAASEIRAIEARLQAASKGGGLFGRKR